MRTLIISLVMLFISPVIAQDFTPGYYIIEQEAKYAVLAPSGGDYNLDMSTGCYTYPSLENLYMAAGEVVVAFEYSGGKVYCFDSNGRKLVFESLSTLTKAPQMPGAGIGVMIETIPLIDGSSLSEGAYYWVVGQDLSKSTIKIQINNRITHEIPELKIQLIGVYIKNLAKVATMRPVQ